MPKNKEVQSQSIPKTVNEFQDRVKNLWHKVAPKLQVGLFTLRYEVIRYRRLIIGGIILFIALISINSLIFIAKPGDLFFTIKLYYEKALWPVDNVEFTQKWQNLQHTANDRANSYIKLAQSDSCVQLELAEQELFSVWQTMYSESANLTDEEFARFAKQNLELAESAVASGGSCHKSEPMSKMALVFEVLLSSKNQLDLSRLIDYKQHVIDNFSEQRDLLQNTQIKDQEQLSNINDLLLVASRLQTEIDKSITAGNQLESVIKLESGLLAINNAKQLLAGKEDFQNWYDAIYAICTLKTDSLCEKAELAGKVNSVESLANNYSRIEYGESFFRDYLEMLTAKPVISQPQ